MKKIFVKLSYALLVAILVSSNYLQGGATLENGDNGAYENGASSPTFVWNTFQGGALEDGAADITVDSLGYIFITGHSESNTWEGNPLNPIAGGMDAYVAKFDPGGHLLWHTFLGTGTAGADWDLGNAIALDGPGNIYVLGASDSTWGSSPLHGFVGENGKSNVFVAKLNSNGALQWHTFLGGLEYDSPGGIAVDRNGNIYISGMSETDWGNTIPVPIRSFTGSYPNGEAFVAKLNSFGTLQWHTFLGGTDHEFGWDLIHDGVGNIYTLGQSGSTWGNSPIRAFAGETDAFVAKLDTAGNLLWNTFLGSDSGDSGLGIALDGLGDILISGWSSNPWGNSPIALGGGFGDGFLAKINKDGNFLWNTFIGGTGSDYAFSPVNLADNSIVLIGASEVAWGSTPLYPFNLDGKYYLAQFSANGALQWNAFYGQPTYWGLMGQTLTIHNGSVFASGWSAVSWGDPIYPYSAGADIYILKVNLNKSYPIVSSITRANLNPTNSNQVSFIVRFSESVTGVDMGDFTLAKTGGITGESVTAVLPASGPTDTYTVTVNTGSGNGTLRLDTVDNDSILNENGYPLGGIGTGNGNFITGEVYTVDKTPPGKAILLSPNGNIGSNYTPTYTWNEVTIRNNRGDEFAATWYYLYVNGPSGNVIKQWHKAVDVCSSGVCSVTPSTTLGGGTHKWWVRTWNTAGYGPWSDGMEFSTIPLGAATLIAPNGDIGSNYNPAYSWNAVTGTSWYYLWVEGPSGNVLKQWHKAVDVCSGGVCSVTPSTTLGGGTHKWWVRTWNTAGYGPWSDGLEFSTTIITPPGKATQISPVGTITTNTPTYTWNEVTSRSESGEESAAVWYYLWVNGASGNVIKQWYKAVDVCSGGVCSVTLSTTLGSGIHKWWVRTWNTAGYGPWSDEMSFTVSP